MAGHCVSCVEYETKSLLTLPVRQSEGTKCVIDRLKSSAGEVRHREVFLHQVSLC